ncbi:MAG: hypothetical protein OEW87_11865, partial [Flavobacteriaceae bacterium]|nr:hypothetical protein [Flavobacteriaceae bacterium]
EMPEETEATETETGLELGDDNALDLGADAQDLDLGDDNALDLGADAQDLDLGDDNALDLGADAQDLDLGDDNALELGTDPGELNLDGGGLNVESTDLISPTGVSQEDIPNDDTDIDAQVAQIANELEGAIVEDSIEAISENVSTPVENSIIDEAASHPSRVTAVDAQMVQEHQEYKANYDEELIRLGETIKSLREDRIHLQDKVEELENKKNIEKKDFLDLQAELDEKKIEVNVIKTRFNKQIEELNFKMDMMANKKDMLFEKNKQYEEEFMRLRKEKSVDVNKIRTRERELEEKLELLRSDTEVQIRNRDHKILELKRRIDSLEFDMESANMKEKQSKSDQEVLENKMHKVINTLRQAIINLEEGSSDAERNRLIKKNLDV